MGERPARWCWAILACSGLSLLGIIVVMAVTSPAKECVALWNASDNAAVRATVAAEGYRHAALTAYTAEGEAGRACYVTMLDRGGEPQGSFVIWPDNLFDNGSLHDYAGPFFEDQGYMSHALDWHPTLAVFDDGRIQRI
jgi:hypothetical protein